MKSFILIALASIFTTPLFSQNLGLKVGTRLSLGQSDFSENTVSSTGRLCMGAGATANYQFTKWFGLATDVMLMKKGAMVKGQYQSNDVLNTKYNYSENYKFYQAELPLMAKLRIGSEHFGFKFFAGPCIAFNLISNSTRTYENENYNNNNGYVNRTLENVNVIEKSVVYGFGIETKSKRDEVFFLDFKNNNGISPIGKINGENIFTRYSVLSIGWMF